MPPFSLLSINGVMGPRASCLTPRPRLFGGVGRQKDLSSSFSLACCNFQYISLVASSRRIQYRLQCARLVIAKIDKSGKEEHTQSGIHGKPNSRRRPFSLRLRPRLRLLYYRLKRASIQEVIEDAQIMLRRIARRITPTTLVPFAMGLLFLILRYSSKNASKEVPYSDLVLNLQRGQVAAIIFEEDSRRIYFNKFSNGDDSSKLIDVTSLPVDAKSISGSSDNAKTTTEKRSSTPKWQYYARKIDRDENFLLGLIRDRGITYGSAPQSGQKLLMSIITTLLTLWISLVPLMWFLQRQLYASNSSAKKRRPSKQMVSFDDVEGVDAAKEELMEIVSCLQGSLNYKKLGAKLPRGVLLVGPPGTGKTLLARAVAGESGIPFFSVSASEFVEVFVGRGAARVRDLFSEAKEFAPSIIFIDELDAVGGKRGRSFNDERDQTLNQLLTEMDGFESDLKVIVMAATNRPEALDSALCRPGRFSRKVFVGEPDLDGRKKILAVHLRKVPLEEEPEIICNLVASLTPGFVGADLANIVNEAALLAARRGGRTVTREDIMDAIEREKFGVDGRQFSPNAGSKGLAKLFPWFSTFTGRNGAKGDGLQGLMGYQTLS
ncbi:probable inactive ATP-dependent zinc metalloprotease FTSHI 3, chloroplastic [Typha angustifolia]|uniref:probable inactive ATP-dependent zinc metalloprotease FTSHI 3, chloroplastic n=1 Tax=Typha angustifolia TaxID=59011 RepID=UPI003C2F3C90